MVNNYLRFLLIVFGIHTNALELKQVVILSRHNVRTPVSHELSNFSPKPWPEWNNQPGELTGKGAMLEGFMGKYFSLWLNKEGLLKESCPNEEVFYAYANNKQRTIASAEAFVKAGFPDCNINVHHVTGDKKDRNFNPVIHNKTQEFKDLAKVEMIKKLSTINLEQSYTEIMSMLDYKDSTECKQKHSCDLVKDITTVDDLVPGEEPELKGPLKISNAVVDSFRMEYYEGFPMENVAWGLIKKSEQWNTLMEITARYHDIRFNTTVVANDIATPLIKYIKSKFHDKDQPKITLLMGHDANILTVLKALDFKPYVLKEQHELTPVGGKIVFQKWWDEDNDRYLLKIEYIYQSSIQLRDSVKLDLNNPPQSMVLELKRCPIDDNGFCLWNEYEQILKKF